MLEQKEIEKVFRKEGFQHIYKWEDGPNAVYPTHKHKGKVSFYILDGSIAMDIDGIRSVIRKGGRLDVPVGMPHSGKVGLEGCTFIVGEEIEGDS